MQILKFRAFSSKQRQGFIIYKRGYLPQVILEDILFQLFEPLFHDIYCPQIYFFSSTDEILNIEELSKVKDYIYVHFLERVNNYAQKGITDKKIRIGKIEDIAKGISLQGTNIYIFSEKQYLMYGNPGFRKSIEKKIQEMSLKQEIKEVKYNEYLHQLEQLKDNFEMIKLKDEIKDTVDNYRQQLKNYEIMHTRYQKVKGTLGMIMKKSGINIHSVSDLK